MKFNRETESGHVYSPLLIVIAIVSSLYALSDFIKPTEIGESDSFTIERTYNVPRKVLYNEE